MLVDYLKDNTNEEVQKLIQKIEDELLNKPNDN